MDRKKSRSSRKKKRDTQTKPKGPAVPSSLLKGNSNRFIQNDRIPSQTRHSLRPAHPPDCSPQWTPSSPHHWSRPGSREAALITQSPVTRFVTTTLRYICAC